MQAQTHTLRLMGGVCHVTVHVGERVPSCTRALHLALSCCREIISIVLDCVPDSELISVFVYICTTVHGSVLIAKLHVHNYQIHAFHSRFCFDFSSKLCGKIWNETLCSRLDHAFLLPCRPRLHTVCNGLAYTYQSVCSFSIAIQIETIVYVCVVCINLMSQLYFSLFPVGGAKGREKDVWHYCW